MSNTHNVTHNNLNIATHNFYGHFQKETLPIPDPAQGIWSKAKSYAIEAVKCDNRSTFYREAHQHHRNENWCHGLEKVPPYLMKLKDFTTELHSMREAHAHELMKLAAKHLDQEKQDCTSTSSAFKATAIALIQKEQPERASETIVKANTGFALTLASVSSQEYRKLDNRRKMLEKSPPAFTDVVDPVSKVSRWANKNDKFYPTRGRGRGASHCWRPSQGGWKPYSRGNQTH